MLKNERQAIDLCPLNLAQIKLNGLILGAEKNKSLIIDAISSGIFKNLQQRILSENGDINFFK